MVRQGREEVERVKRRGEGERWKKERAEGTRREEKVRGED